MEVPTRPSIDISGRWTTAWASRKSLKTFTIAALFAVAFSLFLLSGKQRTIGQANGCDFPAIFNFGDSNSDKGGKSAAFHRIPLPNGNSFFQKPAGRCCNGKVIIDFIGVNSDIKRKLPRPEDFSQALYIFEVGQNDLDGAFKSMTEKQVVESIPGIISQFAQAVKRLHQQGAGTFWIHNTGPIGCLPFQVLEYPPQTDNVDQNGCIRSRNEVAQEFNRQLKERVIQLRMQFPDAAMTYVDIYSAKYSLISDAKKHGFANALRYCCGHYRDNLCWRKKVVNGTEILGTSCRNTSAYISWDGIHYSHAANLWVANKVLDGLLSDPPTPITEACLMPLHL
ncbi:GDSL esterase/lipase At5g14450-like isoform X2 [Durio zibethinus]|uniref:GDSL esterase/lipase At5g14450-like isoform X2 n=1 Tax=Durio zibethinus TaxID=66656 RepID=A0A6P6BGE8_DURZI|nr:GDSL esterase/lipase At5g14450-like isoform X2 [Durio zibethinus]